MAEFNPSKDQLDILNLLVKKDRVPGFVDIRYSVPSSVESLNLATNYDGIPSGAMIQIHGPELSGKSILLKGLLADFQRAGHTVALFEPEGADTEENVGTSGLDMGSLITGMDREPTKEAQKEEIDPGSLEWIAGSINNLCHDFLANRKKDQLLAIGVDSLPLMMPTSALRAGTYKKGFPEQTYLLSVWVRALKNIIGRDKAITVIFVNQERKRMNTRGPFDKQWQLALGPSVHYPMDLRFRVSHKADVKSGKEVIGRKHFCQVLKTKRGVDGQSFQFFTDTNELGFWTEMELAEFLIEQGVAKKSGKPVQYGGVTYPTMDEFLSHISDNEQEIREKIRG